jgi:hypothetical protein
MAEHTRVVWTGIVRLFDLDGLAVERPAAIDGGW